MLRGLAARLGELGINPDQVKWEQSTDKPRYGVILERVTDFDFVVLSETKPTIRERVFGTLQSKLADKTDKSLLTIRTRNWTISARSYSTHSVILLFLRNQIDLLKLFVLLLGVFHKNIMYCPSDPPKYNNWKYYDNIPKRVIFYNHREYADNDHYD